MPKLVNDPTNPEAAIDFLGTIQTEAELLQFKLKLCRSVNPETMRQLEASIDRIDRSLRAIKAAYLYQPNPTRKT